MGLNVDQAGVRGCGCSGVREARSESGAVGLRLRLLSEAGSSVGPPLQSYRRSSRRVSRMERENIARASECERSRMGVEDVRTEKAGSSACWRECGVKRGHAWRDEAERKASGVLARVTNVISDTLTTARLPI